MVQEHYQSDRQGERKERRKGGKEGRRQGGRGEGERGAGGEMGRGRRERKSDKMLKMAYWGKVCTKVLLF